MRWGPGRGLGGSGDREGENTMEKHALNLITVIKGTSGYIVGPATRGETGSALVYNVAGQERRKPWTTHCLGKSKHLVQHYPATTSNQTSRL